MKHLLRYASTTLRAALLLGVLAFANIQQGGAQNAEQRALMPDAFETMNPATIIGDGQYYYIQFYDGSDRSYLSDEGNGNDLRSKDYMPFAKNLQWTLEATGTDGQFYLKSRSGHYVYLDGSNYKGGSINKSALTATLRTNSTSGGGYDISTVSAPNYAMGRQGSSGIAPPWTNITSIDHNKHRIVYTRLRIAKLKDNVAHIIYWQEPIYKDGNVVDRNLDTRGGAAGFTTHHYLTYSGTGNVISDDVSSRRSVLWYYDAWQLPTAAAYHQDGLWTLESAGSNGEFYIKKYGTEEYLNNEQSGTSGVSVLGTKSPENGRYKLQAPNANRFSRIQNATQYDNDAITTSMFYSWDGVGANVNSTGNGSVESHIGENIGSGQVVIGAANVYYLTYANLTGYDKIVFQGTSGLELRVLLNRLEVGNGGGDGNGGAITERRCTIGADGMAEVDVSDLLFVHLNSIKVASGTGTVSAVTMVRPRYDRAALTTSQFYVWNGVDASATHTSETPAAGVVINSNYAYPNQVIAGLSNGSVYYTTYADLTGCTKMEFEATPGMVLRVLLNRQLPLPDGDQNGGPTIERIVTIDAGGRGEVELSDLPFVHLNAIKVAGNSPNGTVTAIRVLTTSTSGNALYLSCANTDGNHVVQRNGNPDDYWYAGFRPVEVPVPNKDEFYQVMVTVFNNNMLNYEGGLQTKDETNPILWQLEQVDDYAHFRLKRQSTGEYQAGQGKKTQPNDPDGNLPTHVDGGEDVYIKAEVNDISKFFGDFAGSKWFFVNPVAKEIPVDYMVTHRISYLKRYSDLHSDLELDKQGLNTEAQSDWWNYDRGTQKVNHFEITHYIKRDNTVTVEFPTVLNKSNDHRFFQRFYNYDEDKAGDVMDLDNLKAHVSLDTRDEGDVQYFLYKNGMVTGQKLDWTNVPNGGMRRDALRRFNFTNSDGKPFTVAVDVSRYDDKTYQNSTDHLQGDLEEPSLTMRYIYYMKDAKEMAANLTACAYGSDKWLETKVFHFPQRQIFYEKQKKVGYRGEFIGLRHVFSDYWVFSNPSVVDEYNDALAAGITDLTSLNQYLVSAVDNNQGGKIEVVISDPNGTGIRLGGWNPTLAAANGGNLKFVDNVDTYDADTEADFQGFYFYDKMSDQNKTQYGDSRFVVFRYPAPGTDGIAKVPDEACGKPAYVNVYVNNDGVRYQLAQFTVIFDPGTVTLPYKSVNGSDYVAKDGTTHAFSDRGPKKLIEKAGLPIAKVTFDYPANEKYHFPSDAVSIQGWERGAGSTINDCGPIPMTFDKTNYSFSGYECNWGSYSIVTKMRTNYGNNIEALPANDSIWGYGKVLDDADRLIKPALEADKGLQKGFLYIDASEQPGDICSAPFVGDFCAGDKLMFSGWISGSNKMGGNDNRCPGGITLTVKGERNVHDENGAIVYDENGHPKKETMTLYRFCPGQIYELDNGTGPDGSTGANHVVWQQFYFEFVVTDKYDRHWIEVNNNCVSSQGGDFMLDNVAVYATVPEVLADVNTPVCVSVNDEGKPVTEMRLMKLSVDYNKLRSSTGVNDISTAKSEMGFVFLDKEVFLKKFRTGLQALTPAEKHVLHLDGLDFSTITLDQLSDAIEDGELKEVNEKEIVEPGQPGYAEYLAYHKAFEVAYKEAFDEALIGDKTVWHSNNPAENMHGAVLYFEWSHRFEDMEPYTFEKAVNKTHAVYREVVDGERFLVMNGNFPELNWKAGTDYYIITSNKEIKEHRPWVPFNICSECTKTTVFRIKPPYELLGLEKSENSEDYMVCEGQIPTLVTNLKGYDLEGKEVPMNDINYDWWLGDKAGGVLPTLAAYHAQEKDGVRLDRALATLRIYYPELTSLDGITGHAAEGGNPALTPAMVSYLKELVDAGQLVLHQKSISIPAEPAAADDPYFYLVACPIHDGYFDKALNPAANKYVAYFCDEPQGLRVKVGAKAPTLKTGFVPNQNGFASYDYTEANDAILSIRLAKRAQFMTVQHGVSTETPVSDPAAADTDQHFLWLPVRDAQTQTADGVIRKSEDYNIYLASTNDPVWDRNIYTSMKSGALPVVGKIVSLYAKNTYSEDADAAAALIAGQNAVNRLCVYFTENFEVREGYTYTLSLPFQEEGDVNTCDGTMLINLKIVPDYEVWTGGAGNTDWNNDENWRRADGNLTAPTAESTDESKRNNNELLVSNTLPEESGLYQYKTNYWNYRTAKDRLLRKGFAPLYCTHILMKANEWGDAPVLYDALDGKADLEAYPFPNLRDKDGWDGTVTDEVEGTTATAATTTAILKFDMQARLYDIWSDTYGNNPDRGRAGDLIAEMYQINSCDEIAFQPSAELLNAHLLNYNNAWVEYQLDNERWYLLGSPLQGTISGEWYAPTGTAQQKTTYYEPVTFGEGYDRYSPAIYQRSWDKAKAVLYEVGAAYSTADNPDDLALEGGQLPGTLMAGAWSGASWNSTGADAYLDRLGYRPLGNKKVNVAIKGVWSNTYNDATVDYTQGGFSVMVKNKLKNNDESNGKAIIRLPKEDTMYDYYEFAQTGAADGGTDTYLSDPNGQDKDDVQTNLRRALNRGRLKTDLLLPLVDNTVVSNTYQQIQRQETAASRYGDLRTYTRVPTQVNADYGLPIANKLLPISETVAQGVSNLGYYLVENPFPCGLDMEKFFEVNTQLLPKYWIMTPEGQQLVFRAADGEWIAQTGEPAAFAATTAKLAPGQGFFVQKDPETTKTEPNAISFTADMQAKTRYGVKTKEETFTIVVGTKQKMTTKEETITLDDGTTQTVTVEVPEVDDSGNYVVQEITEDVTISSYVQDTETPGHQFALKARTRSGESTAESTEESTAVANSSLFTLPSSLLITARRDEEQSSALVTVDGSATDDFLPTEDTELFLVDGTSHSLSTLHPSPVTNPSPSTLSVYTLCGRLATTVNSIREFRCLPLGVESASDAPCTLTFNGVEALGDTVAIYDAVERKLTPLESGMTVQVSGQTQNRYFLVNSLSIDEAAAETHIRITAQGLTAHVIASTQEPLTAVRCYDAAGRLVMTAQPMTAAYSFRLPMAGIYVIEAQTARDRRQLKVAVR